VTQMNKATVTFSKGSYSQHGTNNVDADERWDIRAKRLSCEWRITAL